MGSVPISLHRNRYLFISLPNSVSICMTVSLLPTGIFRWASPVSLSVSTMPIDQLLSGLSRLECFGQSTKEGNTLTD